jgi:hypothetical protein
VPVVVVMDGLAFVRSSKAASGESESILNMMNLRGDCSSMRVPGKRQAASGKRQAGKQPAADSSHADQADLKRYFQPCRHRQRTLKTSHLTASRLSVSTKP